MYNNCRNIIIFLFIFSIFNDNFLVEKINQDILKFIFIMFVLTNFDTILRNFRKMTLFQDRIFFSYITLLFLVFLLQNILNTSDDITKHFLVFFSFVSIIIFFSIYNLKKVLYFTWMSISISVIICFFNEPISEYTFRTTGGTGDPNEFAAHLLIYISISLYLFNINKNKIFVSVSMILFIYGIFMAGSKSAFLGLFTLIFLIFLFKKRYFINIKSIILIFSLLFIIVSSIDFTKIQMLNNIIERSKSSNTAEERYKSWKAGVKMVENNPMIGVGFGDYSKYTQTYYDGFITKSSTAPHNLYVQIVAESGIPIFIYFIFFMILLIKYLFYYYHTNYLWIYISLLSLLIMGMTIGVTYEKYFILTIAFVMNANRLIKNKDYN